jgi:signal peptidase I
MSQPDPAPQDLSAFHLKAKELINVLRRGVPIQGSGNRLSDTLKLILAALMIFFAARTFVIQPYYVPTNSMERALSAGDVVLVNRLLYGITNPFYWAQIPTPRARYIIRFPQKPVRMDIVTIKMPSMTGDVAKRIVGLPGERIKIVKGVVYVNGRRLSEAVSVIPDGSDLKQIRIPYGAYFVLGDNRPASKDSRDWGAVPQDRIVGVLAARVWPPDKFRTFK